MGGPKLSLEGPKSPVQGQKRARGGKLYMILMSCHAFFTSRLLILSCRSIAIVTTYTLCPCRVFLVDWRKSLLACGYYLRLCRGGHVILSSCIVHLKRVGLWKTVGINLGCNGSTFCFAID